MVGGGAVNAAVEGGAGRSPSLVIPQSRGCQVGRILGWSIPPRPPKEIAHSGAPRDYFKGHPLKPFKDFQ